MKDKQFHLDMFDSIDEYTRRYTIVRGCCDVIEKDVGMYSAPGSNFSVINNDYWLVLGRLNDGAIQEVFEDSYFGLDDGVSRDGCYEYKAFIYYEPGTWNEPGELYIDYIEFKFIETFISRDRGY